MIIPIDRLDRQTLFNVIEAFVLREGTDYGEQEVSLKDKIHQVHHQLQRGEALLVYSELYETINILPRDQLGQD